MRTPAELVPVWSGSMQREGTAEFCLSTYSGRSSLCHSANLERWDQTYPEDPEQRKIPIAKRSRDQDVKAMLLRRAHRPVEICQLLGVSNTVVYRCRAELRGQGLLPRQDAAW